MTELTKKERKEFAKNIIKDFYECGNRSGLRDKRNDSFENNYFSEKEAILDKFLKAQESYKKVVDNYVSEKSEYGRRAIRKEYDIKERARKYNLAKKNATSYLKSDIYNNQDFDNLLNTIAEIAVDFQNHYNSGKKTFYPYYIRGSVCLAAYLLLDTAYQIKILAMGEKPERFNSQVYVVTRLKEITVELGTPLFEDGKRLFSKWGTNIRDMYVRNSFFAPQMPFDYAGHKDGVLGYIVRSIITQKNFENYDDIFSGSGTALLQLDIDKDKEYSINDLHPYNVAFYECLKDDMLYKEFIKKLEHEQEKYLIKRQNLAKIEQVYKKEKKFNIYDSKHLGQGEKGNEQTVIQELVDINTDLHDCYDSLYADYSQELLKSKVDEAVIFVLLHQFVVMGRPVTSLSSGINLLKNLDNMCSWIFERDLKEVHKIFSKSNVLINNEKDSTRVPETMNESGCVLQVDPPYISTAQYTAGQYSLQDMKNLIDLLVSRRPFFIFHSQIVLKSSAGVEAWQLFKEFLEYWKDKTKIQDLYAVFFVNTKKVSKYEYTKDTIISKYLDSVIDNSYYYQKYYAEYDDYEDEISKKGDDSSEFIITDIKVSDRHDKTTEDIAKVKNNGYVVLDETYNVQALRNPFSVALSNQEHGNSNYTIITMPLDEFLNEVIYKLF